MIHTVHATSSNAFYLSNLKTFLKQVGDDFQGTQNYKVLAKDIEVYHIT